MGKSLKILTLLQFVLCLTIACKAQSVDVNSVAGCYTIQHEDWPDSLKHLPHPSRLPELILFTDSTFKLRLYNRDSNQYKVVTPKGYEDAFNLRSMDRDTPLSSMNYWKISNADSVETGHNPPAFAGFAFTLKQEDGHLIGEVVSFTDYVRDNKPSLAKMRIELLPKPCPSK